MFLLACLVSIPASFHILAAVFVLAVPDHRCAIPELDNDTYKSQGQWHDDLINRSIPWQSEKKMYSQCELFVKDVTQNEWTNKTRKCHKWVYSRDIFQSTFVTETNMVCDDLLYKTYVNMSMMGGMMTGALILGSLSDIFGRRNMLVLGSIGQFVFSLGTCFVQTLVPFTILKFLTTLFGSGMFISAYVIGRFVSSLVYYGISLNVGNLSGDIYLNFFLLGVVELASYITCLIFLDRAGRKLLQCLFILTAGVACTCTLFPVVYGDAAYSWITLILSLFGKFGAAASYAVIYIYTAELLPTAIRNSGIGISSVMSRIGGILAPYIADIGNVVHGDMAVVLPLLIFGGTSIVAGLLALLLPETAHKMLPESVEDAKNFGKDQNKNRLDYQTFESTTIKNGNLNPTFSVNSQE
ncbi:hypothetical protein Btru_000527 [Bulinus truncatus]|nr:hypothetical protein Btru_000527 [Bulinus truncatus]